MRDLYILLGSNMGNSVQQLKTAIDILDKKLGKHISASSLYKTKAWGNTEQPDFYNQVIIYKSNLRPLQIFEITQQTEKEMGRERKEKWGPRIIDIDILFLGSMVYYSDVLTVPHPQLYKRRFTLEPLCELAPTFVHPVKNLNLEKLLKQCPDLLGVERIYQ